jgi:aminoglycoside 6-adenylyltransferase
MDFNGFIARTTAWAASRDDVLALVLVGSRARTETPADAWSDVDLLLVVVDLEPFVRDADWLAPLGVPVLTFVEPTAVGGSFERRVLFDTGEEVDFALFPPDIRDRALGPEAALVFRRGYRVLLDRIDLGARLAELAAEEPPPPMRDLAQLSHDFWYHALWAAKKLRRGEVWVAWRSCNAYLQSVLLTLLAWRAAEEGIDTWHDGRFLERWAGDDVLMRLREASARYDAVDVARGLQAVAALFADVERDYAAATRVAVPVDHDEVRRRLRELLDA